MKIAIASDHAGYKLKEAIKSHLKKRNLDYEDLGTDSEKSVDFPDYAIKVIEAMKSSCDRGILICGTGIGMSIAANKFPGIRAALCCNKEVAAQSREHCDSNVLVLGAKYMDEKTAFEIIDVWLSTSFSGEERHRRRLAKISEIEKKLLK